jgi:hypothetical protein
MIFVISTNNVRMFALIDNDFNQNSIDQRFAYEWRLNADENSSTNSQTVNETFLKVFKSHFFKIQLERKQRKNLKNWTKFNVNSHDWNECHFKNVMIKENQFDNELIDRQMMFQKESRDIIE